MMSYPFGLSIPRLRRDPYADLLRSLDVRPQLEGDPAYAADPETRVAAAIARDPRSLITGGRVLKGSDGPAPAPAAPVAEPPFQPMAPMLPAPPMASESAAMPERAALPANVGAPADLGALPPTVAAIGDLLSREGQFREQGRDAGAKASGANAFGVGLQAGGSLNFNDEIAGLSRASGLPDWTPPLLAGPVGAARIGLDAAGITSGRAAQDYADQRDYARGYQEGAMGAHPVAAIGGEVAGGFGLPVGAAGAATSVGRGLVAGAGYSALSGAGAGEDLAGRAEGAGIGGTIGGTLGAGLAGLAGRIAGRGTAGAPPSMLPTSNPGPARAVSAAPAGVREAAEAAPATLPRSFDLPNSPEIPSFVSGPYGKAPTMAVDDGMAAIRAGILNNLSDPSLGRAAAASPAPTRTPLSFGPYGPKPTMSVENGMEAIRDFLTPPSGRSAPVVNARAASIGLGALGAGASAAMAGEGASSAPTPTDLVRLFDRSPLGAPQSFSGTSGAVVPPDRASIPAPTAGLAAPALPRPQIQRGEPLSPDFRVPEPPPGEADKPAVGAVPIIGQAPPVATAPAAAAPEGPSFGDQFLSGLRRNGDYLGALGAGLLSSPTWGGGLSAGMQLAQRGESQRAASDLARTEVALKQRKLAQETAAMGGNAAIIKRAYPSLSDAEAISAGSNSSQVTEALKILRDPNHGTGLSRVTVGGNIYEMKPGERPSPANLVGAAEPGPDAIRQRAQAQAEGTAAGKPDETYTPLSDQDRAARGLPAGSYQVDSKGKVSPINPTGTVFNMGTEKAQDATVGKAYGEQQVDYATKGRNAASTLNTLAIMEQAMSAPGFYSGLGAERIKQVNSLLGSLGVKDPKASSGAEVFDALSNKVVLDGLGGSLGPGISNTDRDYIGRTAPTLERSAEGNRALIGIARSLAQRQQAVAKMARDYAAGHGGRLDGGFDQQVEDFAAQTPLFPSARAGATASAPNEPPQGAPAGARQAPDGKFYVPDPNRPGKFMQVQ